MKLEDILKAAEAKLAEFPDATPATVLDWIKHNLMDLWFHKDITAMEQTSAEDLARGFLNLCCLSKLMKVDLAATLASEYGIQNEQAQAGETQKTDPAPQEKAKGTSQCGTTEKPAEKPKEQEKTAGEQKPAEAQKTEEKPQETKKAEPAPAQKETTPPVKPTDKQQRMAMYERELRAAPTEADADKIWKKDITVDKTLEGKDKVVLQKVYNEVKKAFKK